MKNKIIKKTILKEKELIKITGGQTEGFIAFDSKMGISWFDFFKKKH
ncbi:hypothetical protein [uncultured Lactobacillus sp.]|nr:hypothetical protein [uncultured Lactobacillus sp.]